MPVRPKINILYIYNNNYRKIVPYIGQRSDQSESRMKDYDVNFTYTSKIQRQLSVYAMFMLCGREHEQSAIARSMLLSSQDIETISRYMYLDLYTYYIDLALPALSAQLATCLSMLNITSTNTPVKKLTTNTSIGIHNPMHMPPRLLSCSNTTLELYIA